MQLLGLCHGLLHGGLQILQLLLTRSEGSLRLLQGAGLLSQASLQLRQLSILALQHGVGVCLVLTQRLQLIFQALGHALELVLVHHILLLGPDDLLLQRGDLGLLLLGRHMCLHLSLLGCALQVGHVCLPCTHQVARLRQLLLNLLQARLLVLNVLLLRGHLLRQAVCLALYTLKLAAQGAQLLLPCRKLTLGHAQLLRQLCPLLRQSGRLIPAALQLLCQTRTRGLAVS
mmetsp:Transcript_13409/g.36347  ORF Transcript_13409/g.36347 Transcript_13409/m.36347 type:complete len:230 (-) Transcript_13409:273-962(-)